MRRITIVFAFLVSVAAIAAGSAGSATSKSTFAVFVEPTMTAARNGLVLERGLAGPLDVVAPQGIDLLDSGAKFVAHGEGHLEGEGSDGLKNQLTDRFVERCPRHPLTEGLPTLNSLALAYIGWVLDAARGVIADRHDKSEMSAKAGELEQVRRVRGGPGRKRPGRVATAVSPARAGMVRRWVFDLELDNVRPQGGRR